MLVLGLIGLVLKYYGHNLHGAWGCKECHFMFCVLVVTHVAFEGRI